MKRCMNVIKPLDLYSSVIYTQHIYSSLETVLQCVLSIWRAYKLTTKYILKHSHIPSVVIFVDKKDRK